MGDNIYNFMPIPEESTPANDAFLQISDSLYQVESEQALQSRSAFAGLLGETQQLVTLTAVPELVEFDTELANQFGSIRASAATNTIVYGYGVFSNILNMRVGIPAPSGQVRTVNISLTDINDSSVLLEGQFVIEKQVEQIIINVSFLTQIQNVDAWGVHVYTDDPSYDIAINTRFWETFAISPLGYRPPNAPPAAGRVFSSQMTAQQSLGFFGGMARTIASGVAPLQIITAPVPVGGFDTLKASRSVTSTLATATIVADSDGAWDVRFCVNGLVKLNRRYLFIVWLNGVRTECGAIADASNQTAEICATANDMFNLVVGDVLQLQVESPNGPSNWETEFGSFTAHKVGESP